jgi:carbamate kinase
MKVTIALGGNALLRSDEKGTIEEQLKNTNVACDELIKIIKEYEVIITHGNGPQVGNLQIQNSMAKNEVPSMPLDICGSMTQGQIGYMLQQQLKNKLFKEGIDKRVVAMITQVVVDRSDPAFAKPSKPIGPFFSQDEAEQFMKERGETWIEDSGRGWRKVVPSPQPKDIVELDMINDLVKDGYIVIANGGGGIPVIYENIVFTGIEAVIDKDLAGQLLARKTKSDVILILTDVPNVTINYKKQNEKPLHHVDMKEVMIYQEEGHFHSGSMGRKVKAALMFLENGGKEAIITSLNTAFDALNGNSGTHIVKY